jgi:hypothetical protein
LLRDEVVACSEFMIICGAVQFSSSMLMNTTGAVVFRLVEHNQIPGWSRRVLYDGPRGRIIFVKFGVVGGIAVRKIERRKHHLEGVSPGRSGIEVL